MRNLNIFVWLFLLLYALACNRTGNELAKNELALSDCNTTTLLPIDTICTFDTEFPVSLNIFGDKLLIIFAKQDTAIAIIDTTTKEKIASLGVIGQGPEDMISPYFLKNKYLTDRNEAHLYDPNLGCFIKVSLDDFSVEKTTMPLDILESSSLNYDSGSVVMGQIMKHDHILIIKDIYKDKTINVDYPFMITAENKKQLKKFPTYLASNLYANFDKNRIVASLYFLDCFYVFDLNGNLINSINLSPNKHSLSDCLSGYFNLDNQGFFRYAPGYSTENYCYLLRIKEIPNVTNDGYEPVEKQILKIDWNGNIEYFVNIPVEYNNFCVDDDGNIVFIIADKHREAEVYNITKFKTLENN